MAVERGAFMHQGVHIGHRHEDSDLPAGERFGDGELVKIEGVVVVNRRPKPVTQVAHRISRPGRSADGRQFLLRRQRKIRLQAALDHGLMGNGGEGGPVGGLASGNGLWSIRHGGGCVLGLAS